MDSHYWGPEPMAMDMSSASTLLSIYNETYWQTEIHHDCLGQKAETTESVCMRWLAG
jgi:hypothetical protein